MKSETSQEWNKLSMKNMAQRKLLEIISYCPHRVKIAQLRPTVFDVAKIQELLNNNKINVSGQTYPGTLMVNLDKFLNHSVLNSRTYCEITFFAAL